MRLKSVWTSKLLPFGFLALLAMLVSACSPINMQSAVALGNTGVQTSTNYQNAATTISPGLDNFLEGQYMLAALEPQKYSAPSKETTDSINQLKTALAARARLLGRLSQVYTSFVALASYDASGNVQTGLSNLDGAINAYAKTLGSAAPISRVANAAISHAGGCIASEVQKQMVLKASEAIVLRLNAIVPLLGKESDTYASLKNEITRGQRDTAISLWKHGIGAPDPILSDQIGSFGLTYVSGSYSHACGKVAASARETCQKQFDAAIRAAVEDRANRMANLEAETMLSNQTALNGLIAAHEDFGKGKPLDLTTVTAQLATIRGVIQDINDSQTSGAQNK
jgi:hypothetical protein